MNKVATEAKINVTCIGKNTNKQATNNNINTRPI